MRKPVVSGKFYPNNKDELLSTINDCLIDTSKNKVTAVIVPHAGYFFSGKCAGEAYSIIKNSKINKFVIIGLNHYGYGSGISNEDWESPLGIAKCNKELVSSICKETGIRIDENCHAKEHSIEVQLPFLQTIKKRFTFAAISLGSPIENLGENLRKCINDAIIIISSDFTHFGPNYGYVPFTTNIKENLNKLDMNAIDYIKNIDPAGFKKYLLESHITICGFVPIITALEYFKGSKQKAELLSYYTSGDVLGDYNNSVSYASILFEQNVY